MPLTSGPVSAFLALQYGNNFAIQAAVGALAGISCSAVFCLVYVWVARRSPTHAWHLSILTGTLAFLLTIGLWSRINLSLLPTAAVVFTILALVLLAMPRHSGITRTVVPPVWDIPLRIVVATTFIVLLTALAGKLGAQMSGLLSPYPIFTSTLGVFTHHQQGANAAIQFMRGVVLGAFSYASFFVVVGLTLNHINLSLVYTLGILAVLAVNSISYLITRRTGRQVGFQIGGAGMQE
jgi:hypothetical protein